MKKMMLTVLVLGVWCVTIAQDDQLQNKNIKFGVKAGMNFANATGSGIELFTDGESSDSKLGIAIGGFLEYGLSEKFSLQPELFYSQQGFKKSGSNSAEFTMKLDYINIPLLAKYNVSDNFSVMVGPQIGFLLSSKIDTERQQTTLEPVKSTATETDLKEFFKKTDFGLNFGMGYQLDSGFGINARYNLGLKDIFDFTASDIIDVDSDNRVNSKMASTGYVIKNRVLNVSVFYTF